MTDKFPEQTMWQPECFSGDDTGNEDEEDTDTFCSKALDVLLHSPDVRRATKQWLVSIDTANNRGYIHTEPNTHEGVHRRFHCEQAARNYLRAWKKHIIYQKAQHPLPFVQDHDLIEQQRELIEFYNQHR